MTYACSLAVRFDIGSYSVVEMLEGAEVSRKEDVTSSLLGHEVVGKLFGCS